MQKQENIISYILEQKILDEKTLQNVLKEQETSGQNLISILKKNNLVDEEQLTRIIAAGNQIEFVNLSPDMINPLAAHMVTYEMANEYNIIPVKKDGKKLMVAMSSPLNLAVRDELETRTGLKIVPLAATQNAIKQAITYHFNVQNVTRQAIASMRLTTDSRKDESAEVVEPEDKSPQVTNAPITKLVSSIITSAIDAGASDIHIEPQQPDMRVRYRIDGILHDAIRVPSSAQLEVISHIKVTSDMDISEQRLPQDGHMMVRHNGKEYDMRVSSLPGVGGEKIVIRILDKDANRWSLDTVAPSPDDNQKFRELVSNSYGMVLLTGPTGSGKTTTLYSVLQLLNTPEQNIVTVEDPVEYRLDGITQMQVRPTAGLTFASALRSIVRQDPDIILVGEIRDYETAEIAISAALTGHLVLSTLHTNDAAGAISRLINLGVAPFLVASALLGSVAQRLVRTTCPKCKQVYHPSEEDLNHLFGKSHWDKKKEFHRGKGCNNCHNTGYHGRKGIFEIMPISPTIRKMVVDGSSDDVIRQQAIKEGMKTLHKSAANEILAGATTIDEIMRVINVRIE
ncbi:MAG: type II/IV secretion system protein [Sedimentisphaerales bacterium]|nr:type II/IV secretion system protein [Sedimentisphaerales bacterium]